MKAAVIGAGTESLHTIYIAQELGQEVIALDGNPRAPGLTAAAHGFAVDISDETKTIETLIREKVDFLLTPPIGRVLTTVGAANDALHLPGISKEATVLCTDKYLFHIRLNAQGLRNCHCYLAGKESGELTYPAIMKPRFGSGSRGIFFLQDNRELEQALQEIGNQEDYVLEEAVPGVEYGVDGAVDKDQFQLILLRKKLLTPPPARQAVGYLSVIPEEEPALIKQVQDYLSQVTKTLGLQDCLLHADLMINEKEIFIIELSARPSGHNLHNLFTPLATGVDMAEEYIKCRIGRSYNYQSKNTKKMMIRYFDITGKVTSVPNVETVEKQLAQAGNQTKLIHWQCNILPGDRLEPVTTGHSLMGRGFFILEAPSEEELQRTAEEILELFALIL